LVRARPPNRVAVARTTEVHRVLPVRHLDRRGDDAAFVARDPGPPPVTEVRGQRGELPARVAPLPERADQPPGQVPSVGALVEPAEIHVVEQLDPPGGRLAHDLDTGTLGA